MILINLVSEKLDAKTLIDKLKQIQEMTLKLCKSSVFAVKTNTRIACYITDIILLKPRSRVARSVHVGTIVETCPVVTVTVMIKVLDINCGMNSGF